MPLGSRARADGYLLPQHERCCQFIVLFVGGVTANAYTSEMPKAKHKEVVVLGLGSHKQRASNHPEGEMMHVMIPTYRHTATHTHTHTEARIRVEKKGSGDLFPSN